MFYRERDDLLPFGNLPMPAIWLDSEGQIGRLNTLAEALLKTAASSETEAGGATGTSMQLKWLEGELAKFAGLAVSEYAFEKELATANGFRWFNVVVTRLGELSESSTGRLIVLVDITAQKGLEKLLRQTQRDLEEQVKERAAELAWANASLRKYIDECKRSAVALQKLSSAVEQTADHVIITDKNGVIEYVNPAFQKLTGFTKTEAIGKTPRIVKSGEHPPKFFEQLWKTILAGEVVRAEFINRKKNGELYYEEKTITPIKDEQSRITHFVSVGRGRMKS